jgi:hypothetical protein
MYFFIDSKSFNLNSLEIGLKKPKTSLYQLFVGALCSVKTTLKNGEFFFQALANLIFNIR